MKNQNKTNACRTQIADISVAGKELSEEHLRIVSGGSWVSSLFASGHFGKYQTLKIYRTCTITMDGVCNPTVEDTVNTEDISFSFQ